MKKKIQQVPPETSGKSMLCLFFFFSVFLSCFHVCFPELSSTQTNTMMELSRILNILDWNLPGSERNPCLWEGVICSRPENSSVISLSLSGLDLSNSSFLPLVCQIQTLESLDVSNNSLSSIPDGFITNCGTLVGLNLSRNQVSSFPFRNLSRLEVLDISYNRLSGNIREYGFDGLVQLKNLSLNFNKLAGSVPTSLAKTLVNLEVSHNQLSGSIPEGIEDYQELRLIDLGDNQLNGPLPGSLGNLPKLETLLLSNNTGLNGSIPESLSRIQTLRRFAANKNRFTGAIPSGITKHLENLDLSFNLLNGSIPDDLLSQPQLVSVDLSSNRLAGWLPKSISHSLVRLRLGSNELTGSVPPAAFVSGSVQMKLTYLEMENNRLTGHIPPSFGDLASLNLLNLERNQFTGTIPPSLGNITSLQGLKLQQNKLSGEIPDDIGLLSKLLILDMSWNSLSGSIPSSLSKLRELTNMKLQGNNLSGAIPESIGDLTSLLELQLGQNKLRGMIPMIMPPKLQISLNLSTNMFQGPIPSTTSFSKLDRLEVLDLSNNNFSGDIPQDLTTLISLRQLILSNNQLTGNTPKFTHNVSIDVTGNPGIIEITDDGVFIKPSGKKSKQVAIGVTALVVALVIIITVIMLKLLPNGGGGVNSSMQADDPDEEEGSTVLPEVIHGKLLTSNSLHKSNINFNKAVEAVAHAPLFKTMFWSYYTVVMPSGSSYFIKKLNTRDRVFQQQASSEQLELDLEMLGKLHHSNVMVPLAYLLYSQGLLLFYEFAHTHTLYDLLHNHPTHLVDWTSRYSIALGIAQGICYLHGSSSSKSNTSREPILVPDLSSKKIMLKSLTEPLVADIELFKVIDPSRSNSSLSAVAGTIGYIPPEYAYTMRVTMAGNVYSFGVILLELLTGKPAVSQGRELAKWVQQSQQEQRNNILDLILVTKTSPVATKQMIRALSIALSCINISPGARPKMKTVLRMLTRL